MHDKDTGTGTSVDRDLIAKDRTGYRIHDEPDVSFDTAKFDVSFIGDKGVPAFIIIVVNERLDIL